ncbi:MAG: PP2C family protein-serine/threonine phosphatase [Planctomycetota bacterium]|nr:PP2C family protein-serine/threonine phosphatase [Planctomycetota bacterium]MDA1178887.1 PP2C family protein-serine/threonine phosphatase [Planctomycetota bacterium]
MNTISQADVDKALSDSQLIRQLREEVAAAKQSLATHRREVDLQLGIAAQIHRSLLPKPIRHPRIDVDIRYLPMDAVGGDYCQVRFPDQSNCYITICDVEGHGVGPSLLAAWVSSEVRRFIMDRLSPVEIVRSLNRFIFDYFQEAHLLLSFMAARIDLENRTLTFSGGGHPAAFLLRSDGGAVHALRSQNMLIGVEEDCLYGEPEHTHSLASGDRLLFYTDGITDASDRHGRQLGQGRLSEIAVAALSVDAFSMADRILDDVATYRHGPPTDDVTLIVVETK